MKISSTFFEVEGQRYLYDRYSNEFLCINNDVVNNINTHEEVADVELQQLLKKYDIFQPHIIDKISISNIYDTRTKLINKMYHEINQLVFITTEDCNMRCKYCVYSGSYKNMRVHNSNHKLSFDVA